MQTATSATNLPQVFSTFVGRAREREDVLAALPRTRLLVLTGAGGSGKTRLALELAAASGESFPDGVWWVDLAPLASGDQVAGALSAVLGVEPFPGRSETQAATNRLVTDRALVVVDNCEHVLEAAADLCEALLRGCPQVAIVATSRAPLGIPGETDWRVPSLGLPRSDDREDVAFADASGLFVERAVRACPGFELNDENAGLVRRICRMVDGLPLAVELAAARVRMLSLEQIAEGLDDPLRLLTGGRRGTLPRHQTLRASVDWSYELLSVSERVLFQRLAVFAGGWSLEAVEAVCSGDGLGRDAILDVLAALVDHSLVVVEEHDRVARYRLLETVRQYALERLDDSGELPALHDRHLDFFVALCDQAGQASHTALVHRWFGRLELEKSNIHVAINHAFDSRPEEALKIGVALTTWWRFAGQLAVGRQALTRALDRARSPSPIRARALWGAGFLAHFGGDHDAMFRYTQQALDTAHAVGDEWTLAMALTSASGAQMFRDPAGSRSGFERAIELAVRVGDPWVLMISRATLGRSYLVSDDVVQGERLFHEVEQLIGAVGAEAVTHTGYGLGWCAMQRCDFDRSKKYYADASEAARQLGDPITDALIDRMLTWTELVQGQTEVALERIATSEARAIAKGAFMAVPGARTERARALAALGRLDEARDLLEAVVAGGADLGWHYCAALLALADVLRALGDGAGCGARAAQARDLADRLGTRSHRASARELLARLSIGSGQWSKADTLLHEALALRLEMGVPIGLPQTLEGLALVAAGFESYSEAARLLGAAERARADLTLVRWPLDTPEIDGMEVTLTEALGADGFAEARAEGAGMSLEEAVAWARRRRGERKRPSRGWESLTPTEQQIVELVAQGLTNPEIAKRMFISSGTAKVHLAHIFQKTNVHSRAELAALTVSQSA